MLLINACSSGDRLRALSLGEAALPRPRPLYWDWGRGLLLYWE